MLRNLTSTPFPGDVYPVNPRQESVQGLRAYSSISDLPERADLAVVCAPARAVPGIVRECGEAVHPVLEKPAEREHPKEAPASIDDR